MPLPLAKETKFGIQTRLPTPGLTEKTVEMLDQLDFDLYAVRMHLRALPSHNYDRGSALSQEIDQLRRRRHRQLLARHHRIHHYEPA